MDVSVRHDDPSVLPLNNRTAGFQFFSAHWRTNKRNITKRNTIPGHSVRSLISVVTEPFPRCIPSVKLSLFPLSSSLRCRCLNQTKAYSGSGMTSEMSVCGRTLEGILGKSHGFIQCTICFQCLMTSDFFPLSAIGYLQLVTSLLPPTHTRKSFKTLFTVNWILFFIDSFRELLCGTPVLGLSLKRKPGIQVMFWATLDPVWLNDGSCVRSLWFSLTIRHYH